MLPCFPEVGCREHGYRGTQLRQPRRAPALCRLHARLSLGELRAEGVYSQESSPLPKHVCSVSLISTFILSPWPISLLIKNQAIKHAFA